MEYEGTGGGRGHESSRMRGGWEMSLIWRERERRLPNSTYYKQNTISLHSVAL